ncbi:hypothetical protein BKA65DRAFT_562516 [Rhexocercosporidium sp. MPI-PUGE-AT-0058]|nr:hypothetical protein BKA65DRAFT_562516 [Rhexocercosporidium sp. MPI-PUGE-AT-0058]
MSTPASGYYTYAHATPCTAFLDPNLSNLRCFRTQPYFWSPYTTEAKALRDEKFKAYNYRAPNHPTPQFETHYEDHFTAGSRQVRHPSVQNSVVEQPQPQTFEAEFLRWLMVLLVLMFALWLLGFAMSFLGSKVTPVVIGMVTLYLVVRAQEWLETEDDTII